MHIRENDLNRWAHGLGWGLTALYVLAHFLILVALVAFGLRAGGWVLPPLAVAWYGLFVLGSVLPLVQARCPEGAHWLLVVPVLLALALMGASGATWTVGEAAYGPYDPGDRYRTWALLQFWVGVTIVVLAALYRWPALLRASLFAQTLLVLSYPEEWAGLIIWRWPQQGTLVLPFLIALYGLALWALGEQMMVRWSALLKAGGIGAAVGAVLFPAAQFLAVYVLHRGAAGTGFLPTLAASLILGGLGVPALILGALSLKPADSRERFPAEAAASLLGIAVPLTLSIGQFPPLGILPAPGETLPWIAPDRSVPDAWLPTIGWAGGLLKVVLALSVPLGFLGLWTLRSGGRARWSFPKTPLMLAGTGLMLLSFWENFAPIGAYFSRWAFLPLAMLPSPSIPIFSDLYRPEQLLSIPLGAVLLLAGRAVAAHPAARWEERARPLGRAAVLVLLVGGLGRTATATREYLWALTAVPPAWKAYMTLPVLWLAIGLAAALSLLLLVFFLATTALLLTAWWRDARKDIEGLRRPLRDLVLPLVLAALATGLGLWVTRPNVLSTIPSNRARGVPVDTRIQIQMRPPTLLAYLLPGAGRVLFVWYPDTGDFVYGSVGFGEDFVDFLPYEPLRPNAPVEVVVRRGWERPYRLRFTTAGPNSPTATPMPTPAYPVGPLPTALPTATP